MKTPDWQLAVLPNAPQYCGATPTEAPDSLFVIQTFCGDFPVSFSHPRLIPLVVAHEPLEIAHPIWAVQSQGDRLDVLSFRVTQQPLHMKFKQLRRFDPPKGVVEQSAELAQFLADLFHICHAQFTLGRELRFP